MSKCVTAETIYQDIEFCQGKKSLPGIKPAIYGISTRDVLMVPEPVGTDLKTRAVIKDDITLKSDAKWHKLDLVPDVNSFKSESQGQYGSKTFAVSCTAVMPGTSEEATAYCAEVNNDTMMYLVQQRDRKFRLIGSDVFPAQVNPAQDSGESPTDQNSTTLNITATSDVPAPFYQGKIVTEDGTINGTDGSAASES